jgi:hypothetical protein
MQVPILNGIWTDPSGDFRTAYPVNLVPIPKEQGISKGYLRPADGIVPLGTGPGIDRGAINWEGVCYRVMDTKLVSVDAAGTVTVLGDVGGTGQVTFAKGFGRLAVASGGNLFYWNGTLTQVTDPDLGTVVDLIWIDGYFMTTDGTNLVVTELADPTSVNPLKYGSSEVNPDPIKALLKVRDEAYALNRYTIEVFDNVGGDLFPFQRNPGAMIERGVIGTHACCIFQEAIAFLGSRENEAPGIFVGGNASSIKISTREIDTLLLSYSEQDLAGVLLEVRNNKSNQFLYAHLLDRTLVYDAESSKASGEQVWFVLTSALEGFSQFRGRNMVWCYDQWNVGDPQSATLGTFSDQISNHWGQAVRWEFGTVIVYNGGNGAIFHQLELVALTGRVALGAQPTIRTSYSLDGETWSQEKSKAAGGIGERTKRLIWLGQGFMRNWRIQRFRGDSDAFLTFARLEIQIEPLGA